MSFSGFLERSIDYIGSLPDLLKTVALAFFVFIEYIFPIFPGDTIVLVAGFLNAEGALDIIDFFVAVVAGTVLGAFLGYKIGVFIALNPHKYQWTKKIINSQGFKDFNRWYKKWGVILILINRFIPGIRALFFVAAGSARLNLSMVLSLGLISALIFSAAIFGIGYFLSYNSDLILSFFYRYTSFFYATIALISVFIILVYWWKKRKKT